MGAMGHLPQAHLPLQCSAPLSLGHHREDTEAGYLGSPLGQALAWGRAWWASQCRQAAGPSAGAESREGAPREQKVPQQVLEIRLRAGWAGWGGGQWGLLQGLVGKALE